MSKHDQEGKAGDPGALKMAKLEFLWADLQP